VYAVRANYNRLLDVARETYKENVGDIFALCRDLCQQHGLSLQLVYQGGGGGFVFALKKAEVEEAGGLPKGFVNVTASKGRVVFSSLELVSLIPTSLDITLNAYAHVAKTECKDERCSGRNSSVERQV
jgi:DNA mismatch repair protein MSH4